MNRSRFFQQIAVGAIGATVLHNQVLADMISPQSVPEFLYIGSYTFAVSEGITICRFDPEQGTLRLLDVCRAIENPSFLMFDRSHNFLYAVIETDDFGGQKSGAVSAFRRDAKTGNLTLLNKMPSLGAHPCHLTIDQTGRFMLVANYTGGNVAVLPIQPDGKLGKAVDMVRHTGSGPVKDRQSVAHAHSVNLSPDNRFAFVCDLGMDKIMIYRFDDKTGQLSPADTPFFQTAPGAGPRHFTFSKEGNNAFVVNELNSTITCLKYDSGTGILTEIQTLSTLPPEFAGENTCADVHIHPNGKFVYASNRGSDSIAVFAINQDSCRLELIQHQPTLGKTPRNFIIHPTGRYLLAANQNSGSVNVFSLNPETGKLTSTGNSISIDKPVCLLL
jgi:6-phosphogluconolactonase